MTMTEVGDSAGGTASQPSPGDSAFALVAYDVLATQVSKVETFQMHQHYQSNALHGRATVLCMTAREARRASRSQSNHRSQERFYHGS